MKRNDFMKWNVFWYNYNHKRIEIINIFSLSSTFRKDIDELMKEKCSKKDFEERLVKILMYSFWCKSEFEITVGAWVAPNDTDTNKRVDIYDQVMLNFDKFLDYVWSQKEGE